MKKYFYWYQFCTKLFPVIPVGNGAWDVAPSIGFTTISPTDVRAIVKFTDISRMSSNNFSTTTAQRRSKFYFAMYRINYALILRRGS